MFNKLFVPTFFRISVNIGLFVKCFKVCAVVTLDTVSNWKCVFGNIQ